jgi:hypothetical protein
MQRQPLQPLERDEHGYPRFRQNQIVSKLLDEGRFDMNRIADWDVSQDDRIQFAQLIGYSLSGFGELDYVDEETYQAACQMVEADKSEIEVRLEVLQKQLYSVRRKIREGVAELFGVHPDDLGEEIKSPFQP